MSSRDDQLRLAIYLQAIDETGKAADTAVANIARVEDVARATAERVEVALRGGYADASKQVQQELMRPILAANNSPSVEIIPKGAISELNGFKSAVESLKRDFSDITKNTGASIELDSSLAKRAAEGYQNLTKGIQEAKQTVADLGSAGKQAAADVGEIGGASTLDKIKAFGAALVAAGLAYKAFDWVRGVVDDTAKLGDTLDKLSSKTGLSPETLAGLKFAAEQSNSTLEGAAAAFGKFEERLASTSKKVIGDMKSIGVDGKAPLEAMLHLSQQIVATKDPLEQISIAQMAFGQRWKEVMPLLKQGPEALRELIEAGKQYYADADKMAESANRYKNSLAELDTAVGSLKLSIGTSLLEQVSKITAGMADAARAGEPFTALLRGIGGAFAEFPIATSIAALAAGLAGSHVAVVAWAAAAPAIGTLFTALGAAGPLLAAAAPVIAGILGAIAAFKVGEAFGEWIAGQINTLVQSLTGMKDATLGTALFDLVENIKTIPEQLTATWEGWKQSGANLIQAMRDGITEKLKGALGIKDKFDAAIETMKATAKDWWKVGSDLIEGLWEGIKATMRKPLDAIGDLAKKLPQWAKDLLGIKSPSRVFMAIGQDIGQGMVIGIGETEEDVRRAIEGLGEAAIYAGDEATLRFIREQEKAIRELSGSLLTLAATANSAGSQTRDWAGRFLPADAAQAAAAEYERAAADIEKSLTDALLRGFEGGKDWAANFRDTLKNMFSTLVLRPIIQPIAQAGAGMLMGVLGMGMSGSAGAQGMTGAAGQGFLSNIGSSLLGNVAGGFLGSLGTMASYGAGLMGLGGLSQGAMLAAQTGSFGLAGMTATAEALGGAASMMSGAMGAIAAAAPYIAAIAALISIFSTGGTPHLGGTTVFGQDGERRDLTRDDLTRRGGSTETGLPGWLFPRNPSRNPFGDALDSMGESLMATMRRNIEGLGGTLARDFQIGLGFAADGEDPSGGLGQAMLGGERIFELYKRYADDGQAGLQQFAKDMLPRIELVAYQVAEGLHPAIDAVVDGVDAATASIEQIDNILRAISNWGPILTGLQEYIDSDLMGDATEQIRLAGRTAYQVFTESATSLADLATSFDGSLASARELGQATQAQYQLELQLIGQIEGLLRSTHDMFGASIRDMRLSVLDNEGQYNFLDAELERLMEQLGTAIDPQIIANLTQQINQLANQAWGLVDAEDREALLDDFIERMEEADRLANERLTASREAVQNQHRETVEAIRGVMEEAAAAFAAAAAAQQLAADRQQAAANTPQRVDIHVDVDVDTPANVEVGYA